MNDMSKLDLRHFEKGHWMVVLTGSTAVLMIAIDLTGINVALSMIRHDLGFSSQSLVWVVTGYLVPYGGALLLGGRLGDLYGHRRLFSLGVTVFICASLCCGIAPSPLFLVGARIVQGLAAAFIYSVAPSLVLTGVESPPEQAKVLGLFSIAASMGSIIGLVVGGSLTTLLSWRWVFLINVPVGVAVLVATIILVPPERHKQRSVFPQLGRTLLLTSAAMLSAYGSSELAQSYEFLGYGMLSMGCSVVLALTFVRLDRNAISPLFPPELTGDRSFLASTLIACIWYGSQSSWGYSATLYFLYLCKWEPLTVGMSFIPMGIITALAAFKLSPFLTIRYGIKTPCTVSLLLTMVGIALFDFKSAGTAFLPHFLPAMLLIGAGAGVTGNALMLGALKNVPRHNYGLASSLLNGSANLASGFTLALIGAIFLAHPGLAENLPDLESGGSYHAVFLTTAGLMGIASLVSSTLLPR